MVTAQGQNMERMQKISEKNNVQKCKKLEYNFDAVNLKINKYLNAKLLKFNMIYIRGSLHH